MLNALFYKAAGLAACSITSPLAHTQQCNALHACMHALPDTYSAILQPGCHSRIVPPNGVRWVPHHVSKPRLCRRAAVWL